MTEREKLLTLVSACVLFAACMRHEPLPCGVQEACPDGLVCSEGVCVREPACDGGSCQTPITRCPAQPPADPSVVIAAVDLRCEYGQECCCGACYPSQICIAAAGESLGCLNTDMCLVQTCGECVSDRDCAKGEVCEADRQASLVCVPGCREDADCSAADKCVQVQCITVPCPPLCMPRDDNMRTMHD